MFTALLRAFGVETRLIFSLQPLGFNFGKQEDAHRLDRRKEDLDRDVGDKFVATDETPPTKKRKRKRTEDSDSEDLALPKIKAEGDSVLLFH